MMKIYILRGVSGSGKSTWAKKQVEKYDAVVISADHHFMVNGEYKFDPKKLPEAHAACLRWFTELCQDSSVHGYKRPPSILVVDNTNTSIAEFAPYVQVGIAYGHDVQIITLVADPSIAYHRNVHGVPLKTCNEQQERLTQNDHLIPHWWKHIYIEERKVDWCR